MPSEQERTWAIAAHIGSFPAAYVALGFLCPMIGSSFSASDNWAVRFD